MNEHSHCRLRLLEDPIRAMRILLAVAALSLLLAAIALLASQRPTPISAGNHPADVGQSQLQPISIADSLGRTGNTPPRTHASVR